MENIAGADHTHPKEIYQDFEIKALGEYHDLYFANNTLLLADIFERFHNICINIYKLGLTAY